MKTVSGTASGDVPPRPDPSDVSRAGEFRLSLAAAAASTLLPGTGHLVARRRRAGWILLGMFIFTAAGVLGFVLTRSRGDLLSIWFQPRWLVAIMVATVVVGLAWWCVIVSAYIVSRPAAMTRIQHVVAGVVILLLCGAVAAPLAWSARRAYYQHDFITTVFPERADPIVAARGDGFSALGNVDRINILLLGSDGDPERDGIRTDSVTVASIDTRTGDTVLLSLPRNLYRVPFPAGSPMAERFPTGFRGEPIVEHILFSLYRYGADHPGLVPNGGDDPGARLVMDAVGTIFDLDLDYYIMVNLDGFERIVDAMGGITIRVDERLPIGGVGTPIRGWIEPGLQHLDGFQALWYARSRATSDDYDRMERQRCVFGAIARQAEPFTVLRRYGEITSAAKELIQTNIPQTLLPELAKVAGNAKSAKITSVQFVPPLIDTNDPDYELIKERAQEAIAEADKPKPSAPTPPAAAPTTADSDEESPSATATVEAPSGQSVSLDEVCAYE
jgi:polyisoprenyl-teichoic acid--peptidoglycan teichoic acid transferase